MTSSTYSSAEDVFADADGKIALAKKLSERFQAIERSPAARYLIEARKLPAATVLGCQDLRLLTAADRGQAAPGSRGGQPAARCDGEVSGFQLEFVDITGARTGTEPGKQTYSLREHGVRDGLFHAGGSGDDRLPDRGVQLQSVGDRLARPRGGCTAAAGCTCSASRCRRSAPW